MKLETKHLAPYLPYNLKCEVLNSGQEKEIGEMIAVYNDGSACFGNIVESEKGFEYIKPILRPIQEVEQYFEKLYGCLEHQDVTDYFDADFLASHDNIEIEEIQLLEAEQLPYGTLKVLLKHHFDVFGLIEKGLAVDLNTLSVKNDA
jgi:hypothetical protein